VEEHYNNLQCFFLNYKARFSTTSILKLTSSILKKYNRQRQFYAKKKMNEKNWGKKTKLINNFEKNHKKNVRKHYSNSHCFF